MISKPPSIKKVAQKAGVSVGTASMALRNYAKVSLETRERVRAAADALGYQRDPELSKLMHQLRQRKRPAYQSTVAVLRDRLEVSNNYIEHDTLAGFKARSEELGYTTDLHTMPKDPKAILSLRKQLRMRGTTGVVMLPSLDFFALDDVEAWAEFTIISLSPGIIHRIDSVRYDWYSSVRTVIREGWRMGRRRIGVIISDRINNLCDKSLMAACENLDIPDSCNLTRPYFVPAVNDVYIRGTRSTGINTHFLPTPGIVEWFKREQPDCIVITLEFCVPSVYRALALASRPDILVIVAGRRPKSKFSGTVHDYKFLGAVGADFLDMKVRLGGKTMLCKEPIRLTISPNFVGIGGA